MPRKDFFFPPGVSSCFTSHTGLRSITRREQSARTNSMTQFRHCCSKQETALGNPDSECEVWNESLLITQRVPPCLPCKTRIKTTSTLLWCLESLRGRCLTQEFVAMLTCCISQTGKFSPTHILPNPKAPCFHVSLKIMLKKLSF